MKIDKFYLCNLVCFENISAMNKKTLLILRLVFLLAAISAITIFMILPSINAGKDGEKNKKVAGYEDIAEYDSVPARVVSVSEPEIKMWSKGVEETPHMTATYKIHLRFLRKGEKDSANHFFEEKKTKRNEDHSAHTNSYYRGKTSVKVFYHPADEQKIQPEENYRNIKNSTMMTQSHTLWYVLAGVGAVLGIICLGWVLKTIQDFKK